MTRLLDATALTPAEQRDPQVGGAGIPCPRVGVAVRRPAVDAVVRVMLREAGYRVSGDDPADDAPPDVLVRDAGWEPPAGWGERPQVVVSGDGTADGGPGGAVRLAEPFSSAQLAAAVRRALR